VEGLLPDCVLIPVIGHSWLSECVYRCKFEDNYSTIVTILVWTTALVESSADHLAYVPDVASTNVFEKVEILAIFYVITNCKVSPHKCHITFLAFARVQK
jgi:hypothetical protein